MVKRSIEQEIRNKHFWDQEWENYERKRRGQEIREQKQRAQRILEELLAMGKPNGQCVKGGQLHFPPRYQ